TEMRFFILSRVPRRNAIEGMRADVHIGDGAFDLWHMAPRALSPGAVRLMMRMRDGLGGRSVRRSRPVARQTEDVGGLEKVRIVLRTVNVVARETRDAALVHLALNEIIPLHPVLVRRAVGKMRERRLPQFVFLQLP